MRILVAEDDHSQLESRATLLRLRGHDVHMASNGMEAIALLQAAQAASTPFDAIVLDLMMPSLNGVKLVETIRAVNGYDKTPIIVTSGLPEGNLIPIALQGITILQKPFEPEQLDDALSRLTTPGAT